MTYAHHIHVLLSFCCPHGTTSSYFAPVRNYASVNRLSRNEIRQKSVDTKRVARISCQTQKQTWHTIPIGQGAILLSNASQVTAVSYLRS